MKHYVINLERSPERLWTWLGYQTSRNFDFENLTICRGIDGNDFKRVREVHELGVSCGIRGEALPRQSKNRHTIGRACLRLGQDILLHRIKEKEGEEWHVIWEDDNVLRSEYTSFLAFFQDLQIDKNIQVVNCQSHKWPNAAGDRKWNERETRRHPSLPLYQGISGSGFSHCFAVTPMGASLLLELCRTNEIGTYEWVTYHKNVKNSSFWTAMDNLTKGLKHLLGSDVKNTGPHLPAPIQDLVDV